MGSAYSVESSAQNETEADERNVQQQTKTDVALEASIVPPAGKTLDSTRNKALAENDSNANTDSAESSDDMGFEVVQAQAEDLVSAGNDTKESMDSTNSTEMPPQNKADKKETPTQLLTGVASELSTVDGTVAAENIAEKSMDSTDLVELLSQNKIVKEADNKKEILTQPLTEVASETTTVDNEASVEESIKKDKDSTSPAVSPSQNKAVKEVANQEVSSQMVAEVISTTNTVPLAEKSPSRTVVEVQQNEKEDIVTTNSVVLLLQNEAVTTTPEQEVSTEMLIEAAPKLSSVSSTIIEAKTSESVQGAMKSTNAVVSSLQNEVMEAAPNHKVPKRRHTKVKRAPRRPVTVPMRVLRDIAGQGINFVTYSQLETMKDNMEDIISDLGSTFSSLFNSRSGCNGSKLSDEGEHKEEYSILRRLVEGIDQLSIRRCRHSAICYRLYKYREYLTHLWESPTYSEKHYARDFLKGPFMECQTTLEQLDYDITILYTSENYLRGRKLEADLKSQLEELREEKYLYDQCKRVMNMYLKREKYCVDSYCEDEQEMDRQATECKRDWWNQVDESITAEERARKKSFADYARHAIMTRGEKRDILRACGIIPYKS